MKGRKYSHYLLNQLNKTRYKGRVAMTYTIINIVVRLLFVGFVLWKIFPDREVRQIRTPQLKELMQNDDIQFIDVSSPKQYNQFHIYGFENIPLKDIRKEATNLNKELPVVLVCQTGTKSNEACKRLKRRGFKKLANLQGGLSTWEPMHVERDK